MKILACDTSTKCLSVAMTDKGKAIEKYHSLEAGESDYLFAVIDKLLKASKVKLEDFDLFAVGIGPGSFTGLRIGTCAFKTFSFCLNKPLVGINSFDVIAYNFRQEKRMVCVAEDAKKNRVYAAIYAFDSHENLKIKQPPALFSIEELLEKIKAPVVFAGNALRYYKEQILESKKADIVLSAEEQWYPKAEILAGLGREKFEKGEIDNVFKLVPLYLHSERANITKPKKLRI